MEGMRSYGWSLVDSNGVNASYLIFKSEKAANKYKEELQDLHPDRKCSLVELFVKKGND